MRFLSKAIVSGSLFGFACLIARPLTAQQLTTLYNFCSQGGALCTDGAVPQGSLTQDSDGNFYGTTSSGGKDQQGTVFQYVPGVGLNTLYSFCSTGGADCTDGAQPASGVIEGPDGNFYGVTQAGGNSQTLNTCGETPQHTCGTIFKITPAGQLTTLYSFCPALSNSGGNLYCPDGANPYGALILGSDGNFYGTTQAGGFAPGFGEPGTIFRMTPGGTLTTLYVFCLGGAPCGDGYYPAGGLIQGSDGNYYGTTSAGGTSGYGTIFQYNPTTGIVSTLASLSGATGAGSNASLVQASDGNFYGTTRLYGNSGGTGGAIFRYVPGSGVSALHTFGTGPGFPDGYGPYAGLIQGTDGNLYGMTYLGGGGPQSECYVGFYGCGTIFRITLDGEMTILHVFCSSGTPNDCTDGELTFSGLVQGADSNFYGMAGGGVHGEGILFSLVALVPTTTAINAPAITYGSSASVTVTVTPTKDAITGNVSLAVDGGSPSTQALVNGSAAFSISGLQAGNHSLNATYAAQSEFGLSKASATMTVNRATPILTVPKASAITYLQPLSDSRLMGGSASYNASPVSGTFAFTSPTTVPTAGVQSEGVTFTPTDTTDYTMATASVNVTVNQKVPHPDWSTPAAITYGTALSAKQLNAYSAIPGSFAYTPAAGTVLTAGPHTLSATFTPTDTVDYATVTVTNSITVNQATPVITWRMPAAITYGTALSATQLDATANTPGTFTYTPAAGTVLTAGSQILSVTFTPTDTTDYTTATGKATLKVNQKVPHPSWTAPAAITYGTALSTKQLNAYSAIAGTFAYTPAAGTVLTAGSHTLSATFTPTDTVDYATVTVTNSITVNQATPVITWKMPAAITYGTALSATQLDAAANTSGTFTYTPGAGTVLTAGTQTLSVTFTPADTTDYKIATRTVMLKVNRKVPHPDWPAPAAISFGTALSSKQLNAYSGIAGTFVYTPAAGTVLSVGTHTLSATFTPTDTVDYATVTVTNTITVNPAP